MLPSRIIKVFSPNPSSDQNKSVEHSNWFYIDPIDGKRKLFNEEFEETELTEILLSQHHLKNIGSKTTKLIKFNIILSGKLTRNGVTYELQRLANNTHSVSQKRNHPFIWVYRSTGTPFPFPVE